MYAALTGPGWASQFTGSSPSDHYAYYRNSGDALQLNEFVQKNNGKFIVGMVSYDLGYELLNIKQTKPDDLGLPDVYFLAFDTPTKLDDPDRTSHSEAISFGPRISRADYHHAFERLKHYIYEGDVYQANLTHRLESTYDDDVRYLFTQLAKDNPAKMAAYLEGPDFAVASLSPEKFISIKNGIIETMPIKGTRPLGDEEQLLGSEKEQAELNMITDLLRNDLGKVCQAGSVVVAAHREIMQLQNISHTYSHITGSLKPDISPIDALLSMFPGGSITGCPKKRAMEIIDELEPVTRSAYCGCMVTIDETGNLESSILIRTIIKKGSRLVLPVGGGIVYDSEEAEEYQETLDKAASVIRSLTSG